MRAETPDPSITASSLRGLSYLQATLAVDKSPHVFKPAGSQNETQELLLPVMQPSRDHGGLGLLQAAYHGVPIVGIPMVADQPDNIVKAVARGFGIMFHRGKQGINGEELHDALLQILTEPRFKEAAAKISVRMRARKRTPLQEAAGENYVRLI